MKYHACMVGDLVVVVVVVVMASQETMCQLLCPFCRGGQESSGG